jgi:hypothetical protein
MIQTTLSSLWRGESFTSNRIYRRSVLNFNFGIFRISEILFFIDSALVQFQKIEKIKKKGGNS